MAETDAERKQRLELLAQWFEGKTKEQLTAIEHGGRLLWPETLKKLKGNHKVEQKQCLLRCPHPSEKAMAIVFANGLVATLVGKSKEVLTRDQAIAYIGLDAYSELETASLLSICIREVAPPHAQMYRHDNIGAELSMAAMYEVYDRLDFFSRQEDVRVGELDERLFWELVRRVSKVGNLSPLLAIAGFERDSFITTMAARLASFQTPKPSSPSPETSTPEA